MASLTRATTSSGSLAVMASSAAALLIRLEFSGGHPGIHDNHPVFWVLQGLPSQGRLEIPGIKGTHAEIENPFVKFYDVIIGFMALSRRGLACGNLGPGLHGRKEPIWIDIRFRKTKVLHRDVTVKKSNSQVLGLISGHRTGGIGHDMNNLVFVWIH